MSDSIVTSRAAQPLLSSQAAQPRAIGLSPAQEQIPRASGAGDAKGDQSDEARLRKTATQLEGVFVNQLMKAMRATVPDDGYIASGSGQTMFTEMLDQQIADELPQQWQGGLADAIYRQLRSGAP